MLESVIRRSLLAYPPPDAVRVSKQHATCGMELPRSGARCVEQGGRNVDCGGSKVRSALPRGIWGTAGGNCSDQAEEKSDAWGGLPVNWASWINGTTVEACTNHKCCSGSPLPQQSMCLLQIGMPSGFANPLVSEAVVPSNGRAVHTRECGVAVLSELLVAAPARGE